MSEMVERVTRAIEMGRYHRAKPETIARRAIEAMREPAEAMVAAATVRDGGCGQAEVARMNFTLMIDEALK